MPTIDATVGGPNANSYLTQAEANAYFDTRPPLPTPWQTTGDPAIRLIIQATRVFDALAQPFKTLFVDTGRVYYRVRPMWTGVAAGGTQRLAWPRAGMFDQNGYAISPAIIPQTLKDATAELAGQLGITDRTLDNDVIIQGIKSVRAGSVGVSFKDDIMAQVIPDFVYNMIPITWLTEETYEPAIPAIFDVIGGDLA
jgi:hypothetical protein